MNPVISDGEAWQIPAIAAIERECFSDPWSEETIRAQLPGPSHIFLTALDGETVIGYAGAMYVLDEGYISNVAVTGAFRRQGVADQLMEALLRRGREAALAFLTLEVRQSNLPAQALYAKHGFVPVGVRKNYYEKPREDALLMTYFYKGGNP